MKSGSGMARGDWRWSYPQPPPWSAHATGMGMTAGQGVLPGQMPPHQTRPPFQSYQGAGAAHSTPGQQNINQHNPNWIMTSQPQMGDQQPPQMTGGMMQQHGGPQHSMVPPMTQQFPPQQVGLAKPGPRGHPMHQPGLPMSGPTSGGFSSPTGGPPVGGTMPHTSPLGLGQTVPAASPITTSSMLGSVMPSPSPHAGIAPSPATHNLSGIASPSLPLNTPGNPASTGPAASPATGTTEEQAYLEKWRQLQKYIEPLKRMMNRIDKDEERKTDLKKMTNLLNILSDSHNRLPMATLLKCEQALEKLDLQTKTGLLPSVPTPSSTAVTTVPIVASKASEQHLCQPLLDAVAQHIHSPTLNHTLQITFGPAVKALHGTDITCPSPPAKRPRVDEGRGESQVGDVLQGEISRLDRRFTVKFSPLHKKNSNDLHLICSLNDRHLPSVPPLAISVPEDYPESSPIPNTTDKAYDATQFLQTVKTVLERQVENMPDMFSLTALLDVWEMSIRKACEPAQNDQK